MEYVQKLQYTRKKVYKVESVRRISTNVKMLMINQDKNNYINSKQDNVI